MNNTIYLVDTKSIDSNSKEYKKIASINEEHTEVNILDQELRKTYEGTTVTYKGRRISMADKEEFAQYFFDKYANNTMESGRPVWKHSPQVTESTKIPNGFFSDIIDYGSDSDDEV